MKAKTYGVMMKAEMIRAYLAGLKTQTRRMKGLELINQEPDKWELKQIANGHVLFTNKKPPIGFRNIRLPYGDKSCTLWFKETYQLGEGFSSDAATSIFYRADTEFDIKKWRSSMLMPRKYSRFQDIPITRVRVERLQSITPADAFAEGVRDNYLHQIPDWMDVDRYAELWNEINGETFPWQKNPWVFVYEFPKYIKEK